MEALVHEFDDLLELQHDVPGSQVRHARAPCVGEAPGGGKQGRWLAPAHCTR